MRSLRLKKVLALSLVTLLVGCSSGGTGTKNGADGKSMQRSSRVLKKKKKPGTSAASRAMRSAPASAPAAR